MNSLVFCIVCLLFSVLPVSAEVPSTKKVTRCDELPREKFSFHTLTNISSPFTVIYTNSAASHCTKEFFSEPARGTIGYNGIVTILSGSSYVLLKLIEEEDGVTVRTINCNDDSVINWWILASNYSGVDGYFCPYSCSDDGISFGQFACKSLSNRTNWEISNKILPSIEKVPGANQIVFSQDKCPPTKTCGMFI
ncbi:hypothetical protein CHUAL_005139 [Chamberlinius hualienensis]